MRMVCETENLYCLNQVMFNCFLVRERSELTLVDTNFPGSARAILRAANSLGLPITRILLTHAHFDHVGSLDALIGALPDAELCVGAREAKILSGDHSLEPGESGKPLTGFLHSRAKVHRLLQENDLVGSLRVIDSPGHTPGHVAFVDTRDNTLLAGDSFMTQMGVIAAGVYSFLFPLPAWFSWNRPLSATSAAKLSTLKPSRLAVGHGRTLVSPADQMARAADVALKQNPS
jgi:glyoxylase-like metal-dependent hydrolase (beta-lactamase superfamily II)